MKLLVFVLAVLSFMPMAAMAITNSTVYCNTNQTLLENITIYKDGNVSNYWTTLVCPAGCDNTTMLCAPPTYQQNLIIIGVIMAMVFIMLVLVRLRRH